MNRALINLHQQKTLQGQRQWESSGQLWVLSEAANVMLLTLLLWLQKVALGLSKRFQVERQLMTIDSSGALLFLFYNTFFLFAWKLKSRKLLKEAAISPVAGTFCQSWSIRACLLPLQFKSFELNRSLMRLRESLIFIPDSKSPHCMCIHLFSFQEHFNC